MKKLVLIAFTALALGGCQTIATPTTPSAGIDGKLLDKCAYLQSGVAIAQLASAFIPAAAPIVSDGSRLIDAYCTGKPITDVASALDTMERLIVAVRPIAARVGK